MPTTKMSREYFIDVFGHRCRRIQPTKGDHNLAEHRWVMKLIRPVIVGDAVECAYDEPGWQDGVFGICDSAFLTFDGRTSFTLRDATELDVMEESCGKSSSTERS